MAMMQIASATLALLVLLVSRKTLIQSFAIQSRCTFFMPEASTSKEPKQHHLQSQDVTFSHMKIAKLRQYQ